jgi:serine protease Do
MEIVMNLKPKAIVSSLVAAGLVAALAVGGVKYYGPATAHARNVVSAEQSALAAAPIAARSLPDFSALVDQYGPTVVNISVMKNVKTGAAAEFPGIDRNSPFYDFFRRFQIPMPEGRAPMGGIGSGFIISPDGIILTNAHVVADAAEVTVKLTDRREFKAKVLGVDPQTDVAALKIDAKNLPAVKIGDPNDVRVGEWVVAIGSPYGFENTVTSGIVSAKARSLPDGTYVPFIQTDVAVNPGNSGGPLFNMKGEVIGINSQIYSGTGGYQGLSFAIPIDVAAKVKDQLVQTGKVSRGRIGVTIQEVNQSLADSFGLKKPAGALVSSVEKDSPAAKAGIEPGDVVLKANGKEINRSIDLSGYVADLKPGSTAKFEIWRKGAPREIAVTAGAMKAPKMAAAGTAEQDGGRLGVAVRALTPEERKEADVQGGLLVEDASGPAARAGIQPGDVVLAVNGTPVRDVDQLRGLVSKAGKTVALLVQRNDAKIFIPVNLG